MINSLVKIQLNELKKVLERVQSENKNTFYAWRINVNQGRSVQTLMLGQKQQSFEKYQNREVEESTIELVVYSRHGNPVCMGSSATIVDSLSDLETQVLNTFNNSLLVSNKIWDLPSESNEAYDIVQTMDPFLKKDLTKAHSSLLTEIDEKVKSLSLVNVNSAELYTYVKTFYFETSLGLLGQKESSEIYFEIAMEKLPLPNTQEVLKYKKSVGISDLQIGQFIDNVVAETLSTSESILPKTTNQATILVDGDVISSLFANLLLQVDASSEYNKLPYLKKGDSLLNGANNSDSDMLTVFIDPTIPLMTFTTPFTDEGMKPNKSEIIKKNQVIDQMIHHKIGQYLNKKSNYIFGNMIVELGNMTKDQLIDSVDECLEILSFSSLLINEKTLTWSSEIKLAKLHQKGKQVKMIKGGVVSGNIKSNLQNFKFSNESVKINELDDGFVVPKGYVGPNHMLIKNGVTIAGE